VPDWTYVGKTGPLYWGRLNSAYQACARGQEQSPLDIRSTHRDKNLQPLAFHFIAGPVTIENTGRGIVVHVDPGSTLTANGIRYQLVELDFHNPSEHPIKGKYSDMEIDMVYHTADGKMAMVAVMLNQDRGFPNALLSTLWTHLPARPGASSKITDMVSMGGFLPADLDYWTYVGSELQPPCTEGVRWYVLQDDLSISRDQFRAFTSLYKINTRGPQDPHGRRIESND
jgi:carbonic anhydrase